MDRDDRHKGQNNIINTFEFHCIMIQFEWNTEHLYLHNEFRLITFILKD